MTKNQKSTKKCVIKQKLKFQDHQHCLEVTQLEKKINQLKKDKVDTDDLKGNHKEVIENFKLLLKSQQEFRREKHNVFTEKVNKITLSANNDITD